MVSGWAADLAIAGRLLAARLRGDMQYRASFLIQLAGNTAIHVAELAAIVILFANFGSLGGWSVGEVAFLYGLSCVSFGVAHTLTAGFASFSTLVVRGGFDRMLVRPLGTMLQVLASDLQLRRLGESLQGVAALLFAVRLVEIDWTLGRLLYLPVVLLSGVLLYGALFACEAALCFWTTEGTEAVNAFTYGGSDLAQYPLHIFDEWLRRFVLFVVPIGFVGYLPALYLLDKPDPLGLPPVASFLAPAAALLFAAATAGIWRVGVRRYRSTGT